ncbi:MAG: hypothetical protein LBC86_00315 [Oscillospiraceae bacterium]|jgi:hypothetical protein|nr:hypothetical protein [Oscillospiraceae bacterium]
MLDTARFDFSKETDIKAKLWEKMTQIALAKSPARKEVTFDDLDDSRQSKNIKKKDDGLLLPTRERDNSDKGKSM